MHPSIPISWNGVTPRLGKADPLWEIIGGLLPLVADRGERIRWQKSIFGFEMQLLISGTWFPGVPLYRRMQKLVQRLSWITSQSWWDWWRITRQHRRYFRFGESSIWERPVELQVKGMPILGVWRVHCCGYLEMMEVEIPRPDDRIAAAAAEAFPDFWEIAPLSKMLKADWDMN